MILSPKTMRYPRVALSLGLPVLLMVGIASNSLRAEAISLTQVPTTVVSSTWPGTIVDTDQIGATTTTRSASGPSTTLLQISVPGDTNPSRVTTTKVKKPKKKPSTSTPTTLVSTGVVAAGATPPEPNPPESTPTESKSATGFDATITTVMPAGSVPDLFPEAIWAALRKCESNNNYAINTGNGYYGAYQFALGTWKKLGYSGSPHRAAPAVQDEAAKRLQAKSGWGQWPACTRKLGLR